MPPLKPPVILGYHGIAQIKAEYDPIWLYVSPEKLRAQVSKLQSRGYEFVKMAEFADRLARGDDLSATCALTFDDGTLDHLEVLAPLLRELGDVPGTVYVCPGLFGDPYPWVDEAAKMRMMTTEEVEELARQPHIEIGSHTIDHTVLEHATADEAYDEMARCKSVLEEMLNRPVPSFCYPRCFYSEAAPDAARRAGYTSAVTCGPRGDWSPFTLRRESLHGPDGSLSFAFKSRGLYYGARDLAVFRFGRWLTRPYRHRSGG